MDVIMQNESSTETFMSESTIDIVNDVLEKLLLNVEELLKHIEEKDGPHSIKSDADEKEWDLDLFDEDDEVEDASYNYFDALENSTELFSIFENVENDHFSEEPTEVETEAESDTDLSDHLPEAEDLSIEAPDSPPIELDSSNSSDDEEYSIAQPSEDVGDRDEFEDLQDLDFVERMVLYFRETDLILGNTHGSGDHPVFDEDVEPEEEV